MHDVTCLVRLPDSQGVQVVGQAMLAHLDCTSKITPGVWILCGTIEAGGKLGPACLAPVEPTLAFVTEQAHHLLHTRPSVSSWHPATLLG